MKLGKSNEPQMNNPTTRDLRRINRSEALRTVYSRGPISRLQVSKLTELSPATVSNVIGELMSEGIIIESGSVESDVGARAHCFPVNKHYGYFIGVDVGGAMIQIGMFDVMLTPVEMLAIPLSLIENPPGQIAKAIANGVNKLLAQLGLNGGRSSGLEIRDARRRRLVSQAYPVFASLELARRPFPTILEEELDFPFLLDNGTTHGRGRRPVRSERNGSMLVLSLGYGVGAGIINGGTLFRGVGNSRRRMGARDCRQGRPGLQMREQGLS